MLSVTCPLSHLKPSVVFIVLDHIHEIASQCFQKIGSISFCLDLQFGTQAGGGEELEEDRKVEPREYTGK